MNRGFLLLILAAACGPASMKLTPSTASSFGQVRITAKGEELKSLSGTPTVTVGGIKTYAVTRDATDAISFVVQGAPEPGPAEVMVTDGKQTVSAGHLVYQPAKDPRLARMVAFGASLTEGVQSASISVHGQTHGFGAAVANAAGAYLPLPLVHDEDMPGLLPSDFDMSTCQSKVDFEMVIEHRVE
jgi:hypothetical protein